MIEIQLIHWNGKELRIRINEKYNQSRITLFAKKDATDTPLKYSVELIEGFKELVISKRTLSGLKSGKWKIYYGVKKRFSVFKDIVSYKNSPTASKTIRYLKPIIKLKHNSLIPYLNDKNQLEVHIDDFLPLLQASSEKAYFSNTIHDLNITKDRVHFAASNPFDGLMEKAYFVLESENDQKVIEADLSEDQKEFSVRKKLISRLKADEKWKGKIILKKGSLIEIFTLNSNMSDNGLNITNKNRLDILASNQLTIRVSLRDQAYRNQLIRGQLMAENFKVEGNQMSFDVPFESLHYADHIMFYLKKRKMPEKILLKMESSEVDNKIRYSMSIDQLKEEIDHKGRWDLYVELDHSRLFRERLRVGTYNKKGLSYFQSMFDKISLKDDLLVAPYLTTDNEFSFLFTDNDRYYKEKYRLRSKLNRVHITKSGQLKLKILVKSDEPSDFDIKNLIMKLRKSDEQRVIPITKVKKQGNNKLVIFSCDLHALDLDQFYWDFYLDIKVEEGSSFTHRIMNNNKYNAKVLKHGSFTKSITTKDGFIIYPYITLGGALSLTYRPKGEYESYKYKFIEYAAFLMFKLNQRKAKDNSSWLIHEKLSETAQDNSFYFFKYCYEKKHEKLVYYVIKKGSEDEKNLLPYMDRVVYFMSYKHIKLILESKLIISSEAKGHGYAWRVSQGAIRNYIDKKKYVFLQHGVLGLKKVDSTFNYGGANSAELFVVSSNFEKKIVQDHFGYPENRLMVTGLARWDVLENKSNLEQKEIIFMPTWRNWLEEVNEQQFLESDYYHSYNNLLNSKDLSMLLKDHNIKMNFYVHPKFMPYVKNFASDESNIKVVEFGQDKINELIMRSNMLITDYSSVAWEMYYLKKPVLFYYFDLPKYMKLQGAYMDIEKERFGDMAKTSTDLIGLIKNYVQNDFQEKPFHSANRSKYFEYVDTQNSERIFEHIEKKIKAK
ncbi:CDP-glycerol glycerophosphotransferase family protein [Alkalicoccobacillus murimartini]|uniref:Teichoic acid biosynthesis protein n=1 Tax=Alkalicoccobacillus murimartini TaxID=171685 RepID=A0ABT9YG31_9BACI|nr:CDP-glycerol glycerophosphotransferase family protein [Alkalicoccobacillus murimartini]MDQ0206813.1 hypothetical protein [Alkalicoccobacillus murimartini]